MTYDKHVLAGIYKRVSHFPQELPGSGKELLKALAAVHRLGVFLGVQKKVRDGTSRLVEARRTISAVSRARISGEQ